MDPSDLYAHWPIFNANTNADFPNLGYANVLYKAEQEATLYQWLETDKRYEPISDQKTDIEPITGISIGGVELTPENGVVPLPQATAERLGFVRSSSDENRIEVLSSGVMEVHSLNVNKLIQTEGDTLVLNSGNSTAI